MDVETRLRTYFLDQSRLGVVSAYLFGRASELKRLPGFLNVLIHEYVAIDYERVVAALDDLAPIEEFAALLADHLSSGDSPGS